MRIRSLFIFMLAFAFVMCGCSREQVSDSTNALSQNIHLTDQGNEMTNGAPMCDIEPLIVEVDSVQRLLTDVSIQSTTSAVPFLPNLFINLPEFSGLETHVIRYSQWMDHTTGQYSGSQSITIEYHLVSCEKNGTDCIISAPGIVQIHSYYEPEGISVDSYLSKGYVQSDNNSGILVRSDPDRTYYVICTDSKYCFAYSVSAFYEAHDYIGNTLTNYLLNLEIHADSSVS